MVGIFDKYDLPQSRMPNDETIDAPLVYGKGTLGKEWHINAGRSKSAFTASITSPDHKKFMKKLGKAFKGRPSTRIIDFAVYNDASRKATKKEAANGVDNVYYAKFIEYGYTLKDGSWYPGLQLYASTRHEFKNILKKNYKKMSDRYTIADVEDAIEESIKEYIELISSLTPKITGAMADSWKFTRKE